MTIKAKGRERPGLVLAAGTLLSSLGVVMVALVCCGVPVLTGAAGVFAAAAPAAGNLWITAAGIVSAAVLLMQARSRSGSEKRRGCCAPSRQSRAGASALKDAGSKA